MTDFQVWLQENQDHLRSYHAWEVARIALSCGFSIMDVTPDTICWSRVSKNTTTLFKSPLFVQWVHLAMYEDGTTWED